MKVILIRHTSVDVPKGVCYGQTDVPVAATFTEEAEMTKKALGDRTFDAVFSSPLTRARLLADYCGYPTPVTDNRLMEMNMGDWEMKRYDDIKDDNLQNGMMTICTLQLQTVKVFRWYMKGWQDFSTN